MKNKVKLIITSLLFSITLNAESSEVNYITNKVWDLGFPEATASLGACVTGGHLYVHGGHTGATHEYSLDNFSKYFLRIDLPAPMQSGKLPVETLSQGFGMVTHGGLIYQIGGSQATNEKGEPSNLRSIAKCSVFNPKIKKWSKITPLPEPRSSHDVALSDGKIYVTGGWDMGNKKERSTVVSSWLVADLSRSPLKGKVAGN